MTTLADRVKKRIEELGTNPFEVARKAGFERSFINDLLIGKKRTIRPKRLAILANHLDCSVDFLTSGHVGNSSVETEATDGAGLSRSAWMPLVGRIEAGTWRDPGFEEPVSMDIPLAPDPRYPAEDQIAFLVVGSHADALGINDGMIAVVVQERQPRLTKTENTGDLVVVRRTGKNGEVERSIRRVEIANGIPVLALRSSRVKAPEISPTATGVKVEGRVISAVRVFGFAT